MPIMITERQLNNLGDFRAALDTFHGRETLKFGPASDIIGERASVVSGGKLGRLASGVTRSAATKAENNCIRTEFLANLGRALGLDNGYMDEYNDGRIVRFRPDFMAKLREILGDKVLKSADFGMDREGNVTSGKPLTARRVAAIVAAVEKLATPTVRLEVATKRLTAQIMAFYKHAKNPSVAANVQNLKVVFGTTRAQVEANVRAKLKGMKYVMDFINLDTLSDAFTANLKTRHDAAIREHFQKDLEDEENGGFDWEMVRTATPQRADVITVNGKSIKKGNLEKGVDGLKAVKAGFKTVSKEWANGGVNSPLKNKSSLSLCAVLAKLIPNHSILKCITSQLGAQGVSATLGVAGDKLEAFGGNVTLDPGNGHDLMNIIEDAPQNGFVATGFSTDANEYGTVDIAVRDGKVTLTQRFQVGLKMSMLIVGPEQDQTMLMLASKVDKDTTNDVFLPLFTAVSTITIPLDQDPSYGQMPHYTTDLKLENTIPA